MRTVVLCFLLLSMPLLSKEYEYPGEKERFLSRTMLYGSYAGMLVSMGIGLSSDGDAAAVLLVPSSGAQFSSFPLNVVGAYKEREYLHSLLEKEDTCAYYQFMKYQGRQQLRTGLENLFLGVGGVFGGVGLGWLADAGSAYLIIGNSSGMFFSSIPSIIRGVRNLRHSRKQIRMREKKSSLQFIPQGAGFTLLF